MSWSGKVLRAFRWQCGGWVGTEREDKLAESTEGRDRS